MSKFGWSYPAGAANDSNAPYNQEEILDNSALAEAFPDYESIGMLYRSVYKYGNCGATIGVTIRFEEEPDDFDFSPDMSGGEQTRTIYCDDLHKLGTWKELDEQGVLITEISVSSIVEGVDQCTESHYVDCDPLTFEPEQIAEAFRNAVEAVNQEATEIWNETHGCSDCFEYPEDEMHPVDPDCKTCHGHGISI